MAARLGERRLGNRGLPYLDLPLLDLPARAGGSKLLGDGFEIETFINIRVAAHELKITEVPSIEAARLRGDAVRGRGIAGAVRAGTIVVGAAAAA